MNNSIREIFLFLESRSMHAYVCVCAHVCMHACAHVSVSEWMKLHTGEGNAEMVQSIFFEQLKTNGVNCYA